MNVNPATAKHVHGHGGKTFYFCCVPCVEKFKADPEKYLTPPAPSSGLVMLSRNSTPAVAYVCPMCPEVRESKPGACPSCGMALDSEFPAASTRTEYACPMHPELVHLAP